MSNNKYIAVLAIVFSSIGSAGALTIAEVAEFQRNKAIASLSPNKESDAPVKSQSVPVTRAYAYKLISTYETPDGNKALINNRGNLEVVAVGDLLSGHKIKSVGDGNIILQSTCKKKTKCHSFKLNIGDGI
ncbi:hypothetical protein KXJ72_17660 (plasmid) [Comamonas aquatica]|nr:hypothetical protein KXJ72_17660 [Comamonas aquatica]